MNLSAFGCKVSEVKMMKEEWRQVLNYEGLYEVSSLGRVRSLDRSVNHYRGSRISRGKVLSTYRGSDGYLSVCLCMNGSKNHARVHRLVLESFLGPCPDGLECCHNNGDRGDNTLDNLRWDTRSSNFADSVKHGTRGFGEAHPNAKISNFGVRVIRRLIEGGRCTGREIAKVFSVSPTTISEINLRRRVVS
jgi:hypothetical protein